MFDVGSLVEGKVYRFTYKQQSGNFQWYEWECQAVYLAHGADEFSEEVVISFRPHAGTSDIPTNNVIRAVDVGEPDYDGTNIRLPIRFPGAVDAPPDQPLVREGA